MAQGETDDDRRVSDLFESIEQELASIRSNVADNEKVGQQPTRPARTGPPVRPQAREIDPRRSINVNVANLREGRAAATRRSLAERLADLKPDA